MSSCFAIIVVLQKRFWLKPIFSCARALFVLDAQQRGQQQFSFPHSKGGSLMNGVRQGELDSTAPDCLIEGTESASIRTLNPGEPEEMARQEAILSARSRDCLATGIALATIHDKRLYRMTHWRFEDYCAQWNLSRAHAYRLMKAAELVQKYLSPIGDIRIPDRENQVRPLLRLEPNLVRTAWEKILKCAGKRQISAKIVNAVVDEIRPKERTAQRPKALVERRRTRSDLSPLEIRIARFCADDLAIKEIAEQLKISAYSVTEHLRRMRYKLAVKTSRGIVRWYCENHLHVGD